MDGEGPMPGKMAANQLKVRGVVFSDLGRAREFMSVEWVRRAMREKLGFDPYPGTLNLRLQGAELGLWRQVRERVSPVLMPAPEPSFCGSRYFMGFLTRSGASREVWERIAVVVPEVEGYPEDKIEVIAGRALKETYSICDGDELTLVFECSA